MTVAVLSPRARCCGRRGFTLIEILVVVAIIALLCAILLPAMNRARFQARTIACRANMHDVGISFQIYAMTYKGFFPLTDGSGDDNFYTLWKGRLLRNVNILIDPATHNVIRPESLAWSSSSSDIGHKAKKGRDDSSGGHSYEYNGVYNGGSSDSAAFGGKHKKQSDFNAFLTQIVLMHDNDDERSDLGSRATLGCIPSAPSGSGNNCPQPWDNHGVEGMNMMFADGHGQWVRKTVGNWQDNRDTKPTKWKSVYSVNSTIDQYWARSQYPWNYFR